MTADHGGRFVVCFFGMTLRTGNREYYFNALEREFPGVRDQYLLRFGNDYEITAPNAEHLFDAFRNECVKCGISWEFSDINLEMFSRTPVQMSFL